MHEIGTPGRLDTLIEIRDDLMERRETPDGFGYHNSVERAIALDTLIALNARNIEQELRWREYKESYTATKVPKDE